MKTNSMLTVVFAAMLSASCGSHPTGACARAAGTVSNCADGYTASQCTMAGGTAFYEGKTCQQLGLKADRRAGFGVE